MKASIYDAPAAKELSVSKLIQLFKNLGVSRLIYKSLAPNDNSKNQPYMAGHLTDIGLLPMGEIVASQSSSNKTNDPKRRIKYTAPLDFAWMSANGEIYLAPCCKLIYYPQYPEVRLSGFLKRSSIDISKWMAPDKSGRALGRVLFLGIHPSRRIYAYLATPTSRITAEIKDVESVALNGRFFELVLKGEKLDGDSKEELLAALGVIHRKGWIPSKRLNASGEMVVYNASNGGGFTLEAELGIIPNGIAKPDFLGWEIKQFGVKKCDKTLSKVLTVMTPEPNGGYYAERGAEAFVRRYGYASASKLDRLDFTGRHKYGVLCARSKLTLVTSGYDPGADAIVDAKGYIALIDNSDNVASAWSFSKLMKHWTEKHSRAVYIPSIFDLASDKTRIYMYCRNIRLFTGTTFNHLLRAIANSKIYYDPGINLKSASIASDTKRRNQFRIKSKDLAALYDSQEDVLL